MLVNTALFYAKLPSPKTFVALVMCRRDAQYYQEFKTVYIL